MGKNIQKKHLINAMKSVYRTAERNTCVTVAKYVMTWVILALREEGFGTQRLIRVCNRVFHYVERFVDNDLNMEQMMRHNWRTTGIVFVTNEAGQTHAIEDRERGYDDERTYS